VPRGAPADPPPSPATGVLRAGLCDGGRIVLVEPEGAVRVLTEGFHGACDPDVSFDGQSILFAGRRGPSDDWNIYEIGLDGGGARQVTRGLGDCRSPFYQGPFYNIESDQPWRQIGFVCGGAGERNEHDGSPSASLYTCRLDGSEPQRVTFNPSAEVDPTMLPDGRVLFAGWQRSRLDRGEFGRVSLFAAQTDGMDYSLFAGDEGRRVKLMPAVTADRLVVFVEGDPVEADGSGRLASVSLRRNLHSYRPIAGAVDGLFHSPSPLPDGRILVSWRPAGGAGDHGVYRLDPLTGRTERLFDEAGRDDIQAQHAAPRPRPDGRSSVVSKRDPTGRLYCLDARESDLPGHDPGSREPLRLRVLEGMPRHLDGGGAPGSASLLPRRLLGIAPIEEDGSFNVQVPANVPIELQVIDGAGMALRSCGWIWVRNHEARGCIGCHEDGERAPENRLARAVERPSVDLTLPPERRRTIEFRRDVLPILERRCSTAACHGGGAPPLPVDPGSARTSPLVWRLLGRATARPWDPAPAGGAIPVAPHPEDAPLDRDELQAIIEWIDLGAQADGTAESGQHPAAAAAGDGK
jgi:hypothetical protein